MIEGPSKPVENTGKEQKIREIIALARELSKSPEGFPLPGMGPETYARMKATEEEFPDYTAPIDELVERFAREGMKVVLGKFPESGNVFILPSQSVDIRKDSISPEDLQINETMDAMLKKLIHSAASKPRLLRRG